MDIETIREITNIIQSLGADAKEAFIWYVALITLSSVIGIVLTATAWLLALKLVATGVSTVIKTAKGCYVDELKPGNYTVLETGKATSLLREINATVNGAGAYWFYGNDQTYVSEDLLSLPDKIRAIMEEKSK